MKTRTLLVLSVVTALAILVAGGVLLLQLSSGTSAVETSRLGEDVRVGDAHVVVHGATQDDAGVLAVDVEIGGVDDGDGIAAFRLFTGDRTLAPLAGSPADRCVGITIAPQRCAIVFDVSSAESSSRVLVVRRGDEQRRWDLRGAS